MMQDSIQSLNRIQKLIDGGLIAISLIILQDLISLDQLDFPATISLIAFSLAIPLLVFDLLANLTSKPSITFDVMLNPSISLAWIIGEISAITGIVAALWHATWIAGVVFLISGLIGFWIYGLYKSKELNELFNKPHERKNKVTTQVS